MVRESFFGEETFKQRHEQREGGRHVDTWKSRHSRAAEHACKSPEVALAWQVRGVARGAAGVGYEEQAGQCRGQAREAAM